MLYGLCCHVRLPLCDKCSRWRPGESPSTESSTGVPLHRSPQWPRNHRSRTGGGGGLQHPLPGVGPHQPPGVPQALPPDGLVVLQLHEGVGLGLGHGAVAAGPVHHDPRIRNKTSRMVVFSWQTTNICSEVFTGRLCGGLAHLQPVGLPEIVQTNYS